MSLKSLAAGSKCPPLKDGSLRLYSMRFCPFAERTRLVLAHHNIPHEVVNVDLFNKPDWFLAKNPLGAVPVLEQGTSIVYESGICNEFLDEVYGKQSLLTTDPDERARQKILMERFAKINTPFYAVIRQSGTEREQGMQEVHKVLDIFEQELTANFFGGDQVKLIDFHLWPFFERFPMILQLTGSDLLPSARFPKLTAWVARLRGGEVPAVKTATLGTDLHLKFMNSGYLKGEQPDYNVGLEK